MKEKINEKKKIDDNTIQCSLSLVKRYIIATAVAQIMIKFTESSGFISILTFSQIISIVEIQN